MLTLLLTPPVPSKGKWCSARLYPTGLRFCALRTALMRLGVAAVLSSPPALHSISNTPYKSQVLLHVADCGCTLNLVKEELYGAFISKAKAAFMEKYGHYPIVIDVVISDGAHKVQE